MKKVVEFSYKTKYLSNSLYIQEQSIESIRITVADHNIVGGKTYQIIAESKLL